VYRLIVSSKFPEMSCGRISVFCSKLCLIYIRKKLIIGAVWEEVYGKKLDVLPTLKKRHVVVNCVAYQ